jgi:endo-1,4-beta-mannosidase
MLTRRNFLKLVVALCGSTVASACARALPTPTVPAPTITAPTPTLPPTATATATATPTLTVTPTATVVPTPTVTRTPSPLDFVTVRGDQFFYRGVRFPINGFNYYPRLHPWRTFNIGEWEPNITEFELRLGTTLGANVVRIFIDYNFSLDNARQPGDYYFALLPQYVENVRGFLDIAGRLDLKVIVTLFDSLDLAMYQPYSHWIAEEYLKVLIPLFANDPRILCWDLQNEPDRALSTVGRDPVLTFFKRVSKQIRALDPRHLQTIGWIDRARAQYFPDLNDYLDFWCFHFYDKAERLADLVQFYKSKTKKPVLLEEFGLPTGGPGPDGNNTEQDQAAHYNTVLTTLEANKMCGSAFWILTDFPVGLAGNPPISTDSPENHFGVFRLDYSEKPVVDEIRKFW